MTTTTVPPTPSSTTRLVHKIRIRALLFFALAVVAGVVAVLLVKRYMDETRAAAMAPAVPTQEVVVAAGDVPIGTQLEPRHLAVVRWPSDQVPGGTFATMTEVAGRSLVQDLVKGEVILATRLANPARGVGMAAILTPGHRAMAVKVDQVIGVAGFIHPGDSVDVIATLKPDDETESALASKADRMTKTILQNTRVLAIGQELSTEGTKAVAVQVVTLEVTPQEAERLALASQYGKINLTMRSRTDLLAVETTGATPASVLAGTESAPVCPPVAPAATSGEVAVARRSDRRRPPVADTKPAPVVQPAEVRPVVEILRGTKVETRTLRPSPDAQ